MKNILCFGDSNTWGYDGENGERFPYDKRWTSLVQAELGNAYNIIPEGLNGRTTVWDDPFNPCRNGHDALPFCLLSHKPLDLVILMLGTNDSKNFYHNTPFSIGKGIRRLVEMIQASDAGRGGAAPRILLMSPAPVIQGDQSRASFDLREFADIDGHDPSIVSGGLAGEYRKKAEEYGCDFLDAGTVAEVCTADGVHLTAEGHKALASAVSSKLREMGV
ncbi:MAG: SGNH/GDSL hydrolase family protein [Spirochaetales bacterium]|uniref:SGNH/GDSL hydrolase family protein n=1 Tax=Candidatus Thalassospirochaeta sargassi TaxID=3119039 RepID=A0AAJ1IAP3_9SPIO|nr:SGNH/GDSL hydrolase family protein [Spirochaetales bacterium]